MNSVMNLRFLQNVKLSASQEVRYCVDAILCFVCSWLCPCRLRTSAFSNAAPVSVCLSVLAARPYVQYVPRRAATGRHRTRLPVLAGQHSDSSCCPQAHSSCRSQQATTLRSPLIRPFAEESQKLTLLGLLCEVEQERLMCRRRP